MPPSNATYHHGDLRAACVGAALELLEDVPDLDAIITRNLEAARAKRVTLTLTSFLLKAMKDHMIEVIQPELLREASNGNEIFDGDAGSRVEGDYGFRSET